MNSARECGERAGITVTPTDDARVRGPVRPDRDVVCHHWSRVFASKRSSASGLHASIQISISLIVLVVAGTCLVWYFGQHSRFFLILGLAFFVCGAEDLTHAIFGFKRPFADSSVDLSRFIPGTYMTGRSALAVVIIVAAVLEPHLAGIASREIAPCP